MKKKRMMVNSKSKSDHREKEKMDIVMNSDQVNLTEAGRLDLLEHMQTRLWARWEGCY